MGIIGVMSFQLFLTLIVLAVGMHLIVKTYRQRAREQRLRDNPPQKECFEVRLPRDMSDALPRMTRFYSKLHQVITTDQNTRRAGEGIVSIVWLAQTPKGKSSPEISCLVYCPPEHVQLVKRGLNQVFSGFAEITTPSEDLVAAAAQIIKAQENPAPAPEQGLGAHPGAAHPQAAHG